MTQDDQQANETALNNDAALVGWLAERDAVCPAYGYGLRTVDGHRMMNAQRLAPTQKKP